jgi:hypothetical protein
MSPWRTWRGSRSKSARRRDRAQRRKRNELKAQSRWIRNKVSDLGRIKSRPPFLAR